MASDESTLFAGGVEKGELSALLRLMGRKVDPALLEFLLHQGRNFLTGVGSSESPPEGRSGWQYEIIAERIPEGASILDLGCGEGNLLARLAREKGARVQGVELDADNIEVCVGKGVPVIQADLDLGLSVFPDSSFEYVILEETLQTLRRPAGIISEMRRVGGRGIVTFPNFGYWRVRMDLAVRGRMPMTGWLPYRWYQTPNIHLFTIRDFMDYAEEIGMALQEIHVLRDGACHRFQSSDNLYAEEALVIFG
ncbi:MAG: methionine biosynthesis protein MetW [Planctomycetota bacterium]|jgi:methionine biosynthesis protein MetW|nr:methionine biosynthesis protein MetW [Planctomycetota bacterium]